MLRTFTFVLLIALTGPAAAQVTGALTPANPKLKELVTVTGEVVRIGDLVENAGSAADIPVFRSPDLGYTGGVPVARVIAALAPHSLSGVDTGGLSEVVVTRLSRAITAKEIETRIARALAGHHGFGDAKYISIAFDRDVRTIYVEPSASEDLQVARLNIEPRTGQFSVAFELPGSAVAHRLPLRFSGTAVETVEASVLGRALNRGETIKSSDVTTERRPKAELAGDSITLASAIGLAAKRSLRSGAALQSSDLMKPEVVQRNESVTIIYEMPGMLLTVRGKALEAGAAGDLVSVLNIQSNRTVQATVIGPGRVSIAAMPSLRATNTATATESSNVARPSAE
jgi:flagella basal body P-ring formation protein FlgA